MIKRHKVLAIVITLMVIAAYSFYKHYTSNYSNEGIFNNVTSRNGYSLTIKQEQVPIEIFIKPE